MCIYYGDMPELTYNKREHIFPAGLGGKAMLPKGYVSDQANELFSPLEAKLMHDSLLSVSRSLLGPGKRGSLNPQKASKSKICVLKKSDDVLSLGYIAGSKGYYINSLSKHSTQFVFTVATEQHSSPQQAWYDFKDIVSKFSGKYTSIQSNDVKQNEWIFGIYNGKYYVVLGPECCVETMKRELLRIIAISKSGPLNHKISHPVFDIPQTESDLTGRVYAKVAINVLAALKGEEYINHNRFLPIKDWILGKSSLENYTQLPRVTSENKLKFPEFCHWCIYLIRDKKICVTVCFYNTFSRYFEMADSIEQLDCDFGENRMLGMICDWKRKKEYTLDQWILEAAIHYAKEQDKNFY